MNINFPPIFSRIFFDIILGIICIFCFLFCYNKLCLDQTIYYFSNINNWLIFSFSLAFGEIFSLVWEWLNIKPKSVESSLNTNILCEKQFQKNRRTFISLPFEEFFYNPFKYLRYVSHKEFYFLISDKEKFFAFSELHFAFSRFLGGLSILCLFSTMIFFICFVETKNYFNLFLLFIFFILYWLSHYYAKLYRDFANYLIVIFSYMSMYDQNDI